MKNILKSKIGFTLIELLVVIGILAVLAAIAIPSVAGLIDRANVSADNTNASQMTNAIERFTSEYELYCQDVYSNRVDFENLSASQGRVYNVTGIGATDDIALIESTGFNGVQINKDTKYPSNITTFQSVIENYLKTSSETFIPKQSDKHYYYSPDCGIVVCADNLIQTSDLNILALKDKGDKNNKLGETTTWIDLSFDYSSVSQNLSENTWEGIHKTIQAGLMKEMNWKVGDISPTFQYEDKDYTARIIGINQDGNNTITFMFTKNIRSANTMSIRNEEFPYGSNIGGFSKTSLCNTLNTTVYNGLSKEMQTAIKTVSKKSTTGFRETTISTDNYKLFLLSVKEIGLLDETLDLLNQTDFDNFDKESDFVYEYFTENALEKRIEISQNVYFTHYFLRSSLSRNNFAFTTQLNDGHLSHGPAGNGYTAVPAFVVG